MNTLFLPSRGLQPMAVDLGLSLTGSSHLWLFEEEAFEYSEKARVYGQWACRFIKRRGLECLSCSKKTLVCSWLASYVHVELLRCALNVAESSCSDFRIERSKPDLPLEGARRTSSLSFQTSKILRPESRVKVQLQLYEKR